MTLLRPIDVHSHFGRFYRIDGDAAGCVENMRRGGVGACVAATIADLPLAPEGARRIAVSRGADALMKATLDDLDLLLQAVAASGAVLAVAGDDLRTAFTAAQPAVVAGIEGGDFLEGDLDNLHAVYAKGVRLVQLVHERINELGDIQTEPPRYGGLTSFGRTVVREMNALGLIVDLAHATANATGAAVAATSKPVIISHTMLGDAHPRCITATQARMVAETGGIIGTLPSRIAVPDFAGFIDGILRLADAVGIEHVAIGTDMGAVPRPVFTGYENFPTIPAALLARGLSEEEVLMVMAGNFLRVFDAVCGPGRLEEGATCVRRAPGRLD